MKLILQRYSDGGGSTLGLLLEAVSGQLSPRFLCYVLEDTHRAVKVKGRTRIPAGQYRISLRREGKWHTREAKLRPTTHRGMLCLDPVPGFQFILIHPGNDAGDTEGCLLVGNTANWNAGQVAGRIGESNPAYERIYPRIADAVDRGEVVMISVCDEEALL